MGAFERKSTAAVTGGATGLVVGVVGSFLHQNMRFYPKTTPAAGFFMMVVLGAGAAFRQP